MIIAGVIEGEHQMVDAMPDRTPDSEAFTRFATTVEADSPAEAELKVLAGFGQE